ncbi:MAG: hypothetical protein WA001_05860 [Patescibacteria group bacterium]
MSSRFLIPTLLGLSLFGLGCLVTAKPIPADAKPVFTTYVSAIRTGDLATIDRLLCSTQNHDTVLTTYRSMADSDRAMLADAYAAASPDPASTDIQLEFIIQPELSSGTLQYQLILSKAGSAWCVED